LPLTSEPGFCTLREQVKALREPSACIVIVHHPKPFTRKPRYAESDPEEDEENPELKRPETENTRWGKKVSTEHWRWIFTRDSHSHAVNQLSLDDELKPIIREVKEQYPRGKCQMHPGIRCYIYTERGWHYNLDDARLKIWANAIVVSSLMNLSRKQPALNHSLAVTKTNRRPDFSPRAYYVPAKRQASHGARVYCTF